jgi:hypothetical protein
MALFSVEIGRLELDLAAMTTLIAMRGGNSLTTLAVCRRDFQLLLPN